jgi:hypothetical protein
MCSLIYVNHTSVKLLETGENPVAVVSTFSLNGAKEESMLKQGGRWKSE